MCPRKPLHLSPSSRLLYLPLPCNPLFVTQLWAACRLQSFTFVSLCLHLSPRSQALIAECSDIEKHKLFGVYGGVIT